MNLSLATKEMFGQNEMNIFQNEERDIFMTREQIGQALDYATPRKAISELHKRNRDRLDKFSVVHNLRTSDKKAYETIIYNEQGIYEIIRKSGQPKADEFYDWVYDLLSELRKGELQIVKPNNRKLLLETALEHEKKIETIQTDVNMLKNTMRIDGSEEFRIKRNANRVVVQSLGGKKSNAYKNMSRKVFSRFWNEFKQYFEIPRYGDLPKKEYEKGINFIKSWQPDTTTRLEIEEFNNQQKLDLDSDAS